MYRQEWRTVYALTRRLHWYLHMQSNGGNKHQKHIRISAKTGCRDSTWIILFLTQLIHKKTVPIHRLYVYILPMVLQSITRCIMWHHNNDASTWKVESNSLNVGFDYGFIYGQSREESINIHTGFCSAFLHICYIIGFSGCMWLVYSYCSESHHWCRDNGPLARYVKLRVAHAPGMPGTFSPRVSDPDMHDGTYVTHVPSCMLESLTSGFLWSWWRGKRSRHSWRMRNPQFYVSGKRPMASEVIL